MSEEYVTRLRDARKWFNNDGQCCGQVDCVGICAAPACIFGEALKEFGRAADCIEAQAAEIARLRAELDTARLVPPLNPDRWRGAINDALTNWMDSILDEETPKDALRRLIKYEVDAALDPAVSPHAAVLAATARRQGMEQAAQMLEEMHKNHKYNPKTGEGREHDVGYYRAISEGVAHILYAAAKEGREP